MTPASAAIGLLIHGIGWILILISSRPHRIPVSLIGLLLAGADIAF